MVGAMWDEMYAGEGYRYGVTPNAWLAACEPQLPRGARVLCVGDGEGRNGVWLAAQGHRVTSIDASARGVEKALALAARQGVRLDARVGLFPADLGDDRDFDAVVLVFVHVPAALRGPLHAAAVDRLAPRGLLVLEAFTPEQLAYGTGGPRDPGMLFTAEQLAQDFAGLALEHLAPTVIALDEGPGHQGPAAVVRALGRRP